jgi:hypothetical protein
MYNPEDKLGGFINSACVSAMADYGRIVSRHAGRHEKRKRLYIRHILYSLDERVSKIVGGAYFALCFVATFSS